MMSCDLLVIQADCVIRLPSVRFATKYRRVVTNLRHRKSTSIEMIIYPLRSVFPSLLNIKCN